MVLETRDIELSNKEIIEFYQNDAELGDKNAMFNMAVMYERGEDIEQSFDKSVEYYQKAAELGDSRAMTNLAVMYSLGVSVQLSSEALFSLINDQVPRHKIGEIILR